MSATRARRFAIDATQLPAKSLAHQPAGCRLHVVDEAGQIEVGRRRHQSMDVIGLAVELESSAAQSFERRATGSILTLLAMAPHWNIS